MKFISCAVLVCAALASAAVAQTLGDIAGEIRDPSGAVVAGVKVSLTNSGTNASRTTESNSSGVYTFPALQPGIYQLRAEKQGFKAFVRSNIEVQVQLSARIDIEMQVGAVTESIEVSAQGALLQTENSTVGTVIENKRIVELPLNGRNALQLVALAPNVSFGFPAAGQAGSRQGGIRADQSISVGGQRAQYNRFTLDGVENTDPNFNTFVVLPSVDALQEFKVQSGIYPAEFGRGATQINISTKPGSNDYHGTLFYFLRNDKLDAKNYAFTAARPPKDPFKWNQFGFTLGGPISIPKLFDGKNRLFFMANYEWFRQRRNVQAVNSVPTADMQAGNFNDVVTTPNASLQTQGIFDPRSRAVVNGVNTAQLFPNNVIPSSRIHPTSRQLLEFLPLPNLPNPNLRNNFVQAQGRPINRDQLVTRFDWVESAKSQWFGRYSWGDENQSNEALRLNGTKLVTNFNQYMASNTRVITPPGERSALRLHAVLQHKWNGTRLHPRCSERAEDTGTVGRTGRAVGRSQCFPPRRLRRIRQRLRGSLREQQLLLAVCRQPVDDPGEALPEDRRRTPPGSLQPGGQPVRERPIHLHEQRHAQSGHDRPHRRQLRRLPARRDLSSRSRGLDRGCEV